MSYQVVNTRWILVKSTGKVSYGWKWDLRFNLRLHQKPISVLVW